MGINRAVNNQNNQEHFSFLQIGYGASGAIVEWYDFMLFAYLAPVFADEFFPKGNEITALLSTFAVYASGFLMGPLGSFFFGSLGDRIGRRKALAWSVFLMMVPMVIIAFLPTYESIGLLAPFILTIMRLMQGFSVGGEYGGTMVLMVEAAKSKRRGFVGSFATMTSGAGVFLASIVAALVTGIMSQEQLHLWGWRLTYIIGAIMALISLLMRFKMPETKSFKALIESDDVSPKPIRSTFSNQKKALFFSICLAAYANITYYLIASYMVSYLETVLDFNHTIALIILSVMGVTFALAAPFWGWLSDHTGRKNLLYIGMIIFIITSPIAFHCIITAKLGWVIFGLLVLMLPLMAVWGSYGAASPELFSGKYRYSGTGISYNIGNSFCGGLVPFMATGLIALTGSQLAPLWLLVVPSVLMLPVVYMMPETAKTRLQR